jgi:hypothetical protein
MPLLEIAFKVRHDCPFGNLSRKFPSARMFLWCNRTHEVVELRVSEPSQYREMHKALERLPGVLNRSSDTRNIHVITKKCYCTTKNSVTRKLDAHDMLPLMPVAYEGGWEHYHAIAFSYRDFKRFVKAIELLPAELVILRKSSIDGNIGGSLPVSVNDLFARLTTKEVEALLVSYSMGYFSFPRRIDVLRISAAKRVPRTTFQERLTRAENNVIASLVPYLRLFQTKSPKRIKPIGPVRELRRVGG